MNFNVDANMDTGQWTLNTDVNMNKNDNNNNLQFVHTL